MELSTTMHLLMCASENDTGVPYTRPLLEIEKNFDLCTAYAWHTTNWALCMPFSTIYLFAIFAGQQYMKSRPPFQLRRALIFWNVVLAAFSIVCTWRMVTAVDYAVRTYGFQTTICKLDGLEQRQAVGFWMFLFLLSKIVEFGDTSFIVLRKSPLIVLHWYHHVVTALSVWVTGIYASPIHVYFSLFNFIAHSLMYSYFVLKALQIRVPKAVSMSITSLQMFQMIAGLFVTISAYLAKSVDQTCFLPTEAIVIAVGVYLSYLVLFLNYFLKTYLGRKSSDGKHKKIS